MQTGRKKFGTTDAEREAIDMIRLAGRRVRGGRVPTLQSIADKVNGAGFVTKSGLQFRPQTIAAIQKRIKDGDFRVHPQRITKTQLTSGDFRSQDQVVFDRDSLGRYKRLKVFQFQGNFNGKDCWRQNTNGEQDMGLHELYKIYMVLLGTGLRASELCDLRCGDVDVAKRMVNVRRGKGSKQRSIIISQDNAGILHQLTIGRAKRSPVFVNRFGGKLSYNALYKRGRKIAEIIGDPSFHLHCLRHTFATRLYNYKKDINFVAEQLGHSSIVTTQIYAKTLSSEKLEQMDAMDALDNSSGQPPATQDSTSKVDSKQENPK